MVPNEGIAAGALCIPINETGKVRILCRDNRNRGQIVTLERGPIASKEQEKK